MNHNSRYTLYAMAVLGAGGIALWAGVSPLYFLLLLVCPLMMFFMMRGMHGGPGEHDAQQGAATVPRRTIPRITTSVTPTSALTLVSPASFASEVGLMHAAARHSRPAASNAQNRWK